MEATHDDRHLHLAAEPDAATFQRGMAVQWPQVNSLAYHWPMIADEGRNGCFDKALDRAIKAMLAAGKSPHVLDIGSGTGLLAMMAARSGAARVTSLEMVPALAAVARHVSAALRLNHRGDGHWRQRLQPQTLVTAVHL